MARNLICKWQNLWEVELIVCLVTQELDSWSLVQNLMDKVNAATNFVSVNLKRNYLEAPRVWCSADQLFNSTKINLINTNSNTIIAQVGSWFSITSRTTYHLFACVTTMCSFARLLWRWLQHCIRDVLFMSSIWKATLSLCIKTKLHSVPVPDLCCRPLILCNFDCHSDCFHA